MIGFRGEGREKGGNVGFVKDEPLHCLIYFSRVFFNILLVFFGALRTVPIKVSQYLDGGRSGHPGLCGRHLPHQQVRGNVTDIVGVLLLTKVNVTLPAGQD